MLVEKQGFRPAQITGLTLNAASNARADVTLQVGPERQLVEVQAMAVQLHTEDAKTSATVTNRMVDELPLVVGGTLRSPFDLAALTPESKNVGGDTGFLRLVTVPEVASYRQLRGKTLSVDARTTGYAFVLIEMLERAGLKEGDYELERAGGVLQRFQTLMEKKHSGTLLLSPFEVQAEAKDKLSSDKAGVYMGLRPAEIDGRQTLRAKTRK